MKLQILSVFFLFFYSLNTFSQNIKVVEGKSIPKIDKDLVSELANSKELNAGYSTKLGQSYLQDRTRLREELMKALEKYSISTTLFDEEFSVEDKDVRFKFRPSIKPERQVRLISTGELASDNAPGTQRLQYRIMDGITYEATAGFSVDLDKNSSFNPRATLFSGDTGVQLKKISFVNTLNEYLSQSPAEKLSDFYDMESVEDLPRLLGNNKNDFNTRTGKIASQYTTSEQMKIFFEGLLKKPFEVGRDFIKISAEELKNNDVFKPGEILVKTWYRKDTSPSFSTRKDFLSELISRFKVGRSEYTILRVGFQKDAEGTLFVKTQFEEYPKWEIDHSISAFISPLKVHRWNYSNSKINVVEKLFTFNLNSELAQKKLDELFNRIGNPLLTRTEYEKILSSIENVPNVIETTFDRTRTSLGNVEEFKTRTDLVILRHQSQSIARVQETKTETQSGTDVTLVDGIIQKASAFKFRLFNLLKSENDRTSSFRMVAQQVRNNDGRLLSNDAHMGFEYRFNDKYTSEQDYLNRVNFIKTAFFLSDNVKSQDADRVKRFLENRLSIKSSKKDQQGIVAGLYFSDEFIQKILAQNSSSLKSLLAQMILGQGKTWDQLMKVKNTSRDTRDCSEAVKGEYAHLFFSEKSIMTCTRVRSLPETLVSAFEESQKTSASMSEAARNFTRIVKNRISDPTMPFLLLQLGLIEGFENGKAVYGNVDEALARNEIEMSVSVYGEDIEGIEGLSVGNVPEVALYKFHQDFDLEDPSSDAQKMIFSAQALQSSQYFYLRLNSLLTLNENFGLKGLVFKNKELVAQLKVDGLKQASLKKTIDSIENTYIVRFPLDVGLVSGEDYVVVFSVVDLATQERVSEPVELRFKY